MTVVIVVGPTKPVPMIIYRGITITASNNVIILYVYNNVSSGDFAACRHCDDNVETLKGWIEEKTRYYIVIISYVTKKLIVNFGFRI